MDSDHELLALSVVVPCYNEGEAIARTVREIAGALSGVSHFELIVVNDGSTDNSAEHLEQLMEGAEIPELVVLEHRSNRGYGAALKTGIRRARAELVAITDADGTYPNERLPELAGLMDRSDMVVGARVGENVVSSRLRKIPKSFLRAYASWLVGERIPDLNSGLRVFRKSLAERFFGVLPDGFSLTSTLTVAAMRGNYEVRFVPIDYAARVGRSKIQPVRDTLRFVQLILRTGMYFAPIRVLSPLLALLGAAFAASLAYDVFVYSDLTEKTMLILFLCMNTALFALLADMIDKRS